MKANAKAFLEAARCHSIVSRAKWISASCPLAPWLHAGGVDKHPSFGIHRRKKYAACFSCDFHGSPRELVTRIRHYSRNDKDSLYDFKELYKLADSIENETPYFPLTEVGKGESHEAVFSEDWLSVFPDGTEHEYLIKRKVPRLVAEDFDLRFDPDKQRLCFPIRDYDGRLRGLHGRSVLKKTEVPYLVYKVLGKYNEIVWFGEHWVDFSKPVVFVESVFDVARVYQCYRNVICPLSASITKEKAYRVGGAVDIITMFDGDRAGIRAAEKIKKYLKDSFIRNIELREGCDPSDYSVFEIAELLQGMKLHLDEYLL